MSAQRSGKTNLFPLRLPLKYLSRRKALLSWALFWRALFVIAPMQVPVITGMIVAGLTQQPISCYGFTWGHVDPSVAIGWAAAGLVVVALLYGISSYVRSTAEARLGRGFVSSLRRTVLAHVGELSLDWHQKLGSGELLDRTLADTTEMRRFLDRVFIQTIANGLRLIYPACMLLAIDWQMGIVALGILVPQWLISWYAQRRLQTAVRGARRAQADLTTVVKEQLDGVETIKCLNAEHTTQAAAQCEVDGVEDAELGAARWSALVGANVWLMTGIGVAITWWLGSAKVLAGTMPLDRLIVFTGFVAFAYQPFRYLTKIAGTYRRGLVCLERIEELLAIPSSVRIARDARPLAIREGHISFRNVSFDYGNKPVLHEVNLDMPPRRITAIVGRSGSGKSSLLRLVARLYDPIRGQVVIDGQPLHRATLESLRSQIAVVTQQAMLFSATVWENLTLASPEASHQQVVEACQAAGAWNFISRLEAGLDTRIGRGGRRLSGGETQRLAIARALVGRPKILLLDEPTSSLDRDNEAAIVKAIAGLKGKVTVVVVAHRLETVRCADKVIVMENGRVASEGTHQVLRVASPVYNEVFPAQETSYERTA